MVEASQAQPTRRIKNYLLQPLLQVKLGIYFISLTLVFSAVISFVLYMNFYNFFDIVLEMTDIREEVSYYLADYLNDTFLWLLLIIGVFLVCAVTVSILYTHKLVGPTYAFRRHIRALIDGNYSSRITLRKDDAFTEVAEELNELALVLESQKNKQHG